jgi:anti-sigma factor RsiW
MDIDDELLMAYADGDLDAPTAARVERALAADPELAAAARQQCELRARVHGTLLRLCADPLPERIGASPDRAGVSGDEPRSAAAPAFLHRGTGPDAPTHRRGAGRFGLSWWLAGGVVAATGVALLLWR